MSEPHRHKTERYLLATFLAMAILLAVLMTFALVQYHALRHNGIRFFFAHHAPLPATDAEVVAPWMTFDYIDHLFALPSFYLQSALGIADSRYPHLTISEYANAAKVSQSTALTDVQNAVRAYVPQRILQEPTATSPGTVSGHP